MSPLVVRSMLDDRCRKEADTCRPSSSWTGNVNAIHPKAAGRGVRRCLQLEENLVPRAKKQRSHATHGRSSLISVRVERYEVRSGADVNHHAIAPHLAFRDPEDEPLYQFLTTKVFGAVVTPADREGDLFELTVYSEDAPSSRTFASLNSCHMRDKAATCWYRRYRGREYPVYWLPNGIGSALTWCAESAAGAVRSLLSSALCHRLAHSAWAGPRAILLTCRKEGGAATRLTKCRAANDGSG